MTGHRRGRTTGWAALAAATCALFAPPLAEAQAPAVRAGTWDVRSTVVALDVPGLPGFLKRMAIGRSKAERKRLAAGQDVAALLAPDPKARCRVDDQRLVAGRYDQTITCPQKRGDPMRVHRTGTYDADGFTGRATVDGSTPKGPIHIVLDQRAMRTGA